MGAVQHESATTWLTVARTHGDHLVHLTVIGDSTHESLCGRGLRARPPQRSFRQAGCEECLVAAREAGHLVAKEERAWLNLSRITVQPLTA